MYIRDGKYFNTTMRFTPQNYDSKLTQAKIKHSSLLEQFIKNNILIIYDFKTSDVISTKSQNINKITKDIKINTIFKHIQFDITVYLNYYMIKYTTDGKQN